MRKRFLAFAVVFVLLLSNMALMPVNLYAEETNAKTVASQISARFPEEKPVSTEYARSRRIFKAYEGQGEIIITNHGASDAEIYINGVKVPMEKYLTGTESKTILNIGQYTVNGQNTLKVLNIQPENAYIEIQVPFPTLKEGTPESAGFSSEKLSEIDDFINKEISEGFPGAVLLIIKDGKIIKNTAYGYSLKYENGQLIDELVPMSTSTMFDLASNTKMFATNLAIQKLANEGKLKTSDLVSAYIPDFKGEGRENIKVSDLMYHSAGFSSSIRFYMPDNGRGEEFYSTDREKTIKILNNMPIDYPTGTKTIYSDTDYMLLGVIIENITGMKLDEYVESSIYAPLGLKNTLYNPLRKGFSKGMFAATEMGNTRGGARDYPLIRTETVQGEVHDEKAFYCMDGVSGHAGLFSNTHDMAVLCQLVLNGGGYGREQLFTQNDMDYFTAPSQNDITFALGWNRAGTANKISQFGAYASNRAIGHTGWTGTLTIIDPEYDLAIVLLTNKKHSECYDGSNFKGDGFETGRYGSIASMVYEAFLEK